jgi:hypothetical protein
MPEDAAAAVVPARDILGSEVPAPGGDAKLLSDFLQKTYWDAANLVFKGTAFYFAILAALIGYVFTQRVPPRVAELTLWMGVATSLLAFITAVVSGRTLYRCITLLEQLMTEQSGAVVNRSALRGLFSRWRTTVWTFSICGSLLMLMFIVGIVILRGTLAAAK